MVDFVIYKNKKYKYDDVYTIGRQLGVGTFGKVMEGVNAISGGRVAIKFQNKASDDEAFQKEIEILIKISDQCRRYVCLDGYGVKAGKYFFAMELIDGIELGKLRQAITTDQFLYIGEQLIAALEGLHKKGLAHMDLKPANIMIDQKFNVKLVDLGLACNEKVCGGSGTPYYMPKDRDSEYSLSDRKNMDYYSLAMTMQELQQNIRDNEAQTKKLRLIDGERTYRMLVSVKVYKFFNRIVKKSQFFKLQATNI